MTLPKWKRAWDAPDPLRGKRGWNRRHFASIAVAAALAVAAVAVARPAVVRARQKEAELDREYRQIEAVSALPGRLGTR